MNNYFTDKNDNYDEDLYLLTCNGDLLISDSIMSNSIKEYLCFRAMRRAKRQEQALIRKYNNSTKDI